MLTETDGVVLTEEEVKRLKAGGEEDAREEYRAGYKAGVAWAREDARLVELLYIGNHTRVFPRWWDGLAKPPFWAANRLAMAAWPEAREDRGLLQTFWEDALGGDSWRVRAPYFLRGFGEGVVEVVKAYEERLSS
jgi:hypothetical protein